MILRKLNNYFSRKFTKNHFFKDTKLSLILLISFLGLNNKLHAQYYGNEYGGLTGGVYAGLSFAQINGDGYKGYDKFGYTAGGMLFLPIQADLPFTGTIAYSLGVQFTQKGAKGSLHPVKLQTIDLNYAEVPLMIHYYRGHHKSNIGLGLVPGYLAWEETSRDLGSGMERIENHYKKFDLGLMANANFHIWNGFFLTGRFQFSLLNIKNSQVPTVGRSEQYNDHLTLGVMYVINRRN